MAAPRLLAVGETVTAPDGTVHARQLGNWVCAAPACGQAVGRTDHTGVLACGACGQLYDEPVLHYLPFNRDREVVTCCGVPVPDLPLGTVTHDRRRTTCPGPRTAPDTRATPTRRAA